MSFLNPLLLLGALAALIPLLIHLWSRRQAKVVDFSSLLFLLEAHRKSVRRLQIRQWLILLLRMAIVALLAMAFARPLLKSQLSIAGTRIHTSCVIVLDNSYSMQYEDLSGNRFEEAKAQALAVAETLQRGDDASLVLMSDVADVVFPRLTTDLAQLGQAIREAEVSERPTSIQAGLEAAYSLLETSHHPNREIYLITDLTRNAWDPWDPSILRSGIRVFLIPIGDPDAPNVVLEEIRWENPLLGVDIPARLEVVVRNTDPKAPHETALAFTLDGQKRSEIAMTLPPGSTQTQTISVRLGTPGYHTGMVSLLPDRLDLDNRRYFAVHVVGDVPVLSVDEDPPYLTLALQPEPLTSPTKDYLLLPTRIAPEALKATTLESYPLIAIANFASLSASDRLQLHTYVQNGGRLIAFLGNRPLEANALQPFFGVQPGPIRSFDSPERLRLVRSELPLFAVTPPARFLDENAPRFYRAHELPIPSPDTAFMLLARFGQTQGLPAMWMDAQRSVLIFNTALHDRDWSNLALNALFVPLIQQSCLYLLESHRPPMAALVGQTYAPSLPDAEGARVEVRSPGSREPRILTLDTERRMEPLSLTHTGLYQLNYTARGSVRSHWFAVNLDTRESDLTTLTSEEARRRLGNAHLLEDTGELRRELSQYRTGREIWGQLILLSLFLMMLELYLANRGRANA